MEPTFESIGCRLGSLDAAVAETPGLGVLAERLGRQLDRARLLLGRAEDRCAAARRSPARRKLRKVYRRLGRMRRMLRRGHVVVEALANPLPPLIDDARALSRTLACP